MLAGQRWALIISSWASQLLPPLLSLIQPLCLYIYIFTVHITYRVILFIVFAKHLLLTMEFSPICDTFSTVVYPVSIFVWLIKVLEQYLCLSIKRINIELGSCLKKIVLYLRLPWFSAFIIGVDCNLFLLGWIICNYLKLSVAFYVLFSH